MICPRNIHWFSMFFPYFFFEKSPENHWFPANPAKASSKLIWMAATICTVQVGSMPFRWITWGFLPARGSNRQWVHWPKQPNNYLPNNPTTMRFYQQPNNYLPRNTSLDYLPKKHEILATKQGALNQQDTSNPWFFSATIGTNRLVDQKEFTKGFPAPGGFWM